MRCALLHGFAGDPRAWDAVALRDAVPIALPAPRATWDDHVAAVAETIGTVDLVIGYSLGARLALGLLATSRVPRAILISVNPGIADEDRPARRASDAAWAAMLRTRGIEAFVDAWEAQPLFATQATVDPARLADRRARRLALDPELLARSLETTGLAEMPDYRAAIGALDCTLVVGALDAKYVAIARATGRPVIEIAASGHDPLLEQPARLADAIRASRMSTYPTAPRVP